jgi:hypothetical protein
MATHRRRPILLALALAAAGPTLAGETAHGQPPAQPPSPAFEGLKALAGDWEGSARKGGSDKAFPTKATFKVVSNGSAVMLVTDPGTPHEMVTMFHRDDDALLATHYCAAMNQPRLRAAAGASASRVAFDFVDGTNLTAFPGRMQGLVLAMPDGAHHTQTWTYRGDGKDSTMVFEMSRVK